MKKICIILPTLNEEEAIGKVIREIPRGKLEEEGYETKVVVIDGGSTDNTKYKAWKAKADYFLQGPKGKGLQLNWGLERSRSIWETSDLVFMLNSDYTYSPLDLPYLAKYLDIPSRVIIVGTRIAQKRPKSMSKSHYIGNLLLTGVARKMYPTLTDDLCSGFIGFKPQFLKEANLKARGFDLEANIFTEANRLGYGIICIPILYRERVGTPSKLKLKDSFLILLRLAKERYQ